MKVKWRIDKFAFNQSYALMLEFSKDNQHRLAIVEHYPPQQKRWRISIVGAERFHNTRTYRTAAEAKAAVEEMFHAVSVQLKENPTRFMGGGS